MCRCIPPEHIRIYFSAIQDHLPDEAVEYVSYFMTTYVGHYSFQSAADGSLYQALRYKPPLFDPAKLSVHSRVIRHWQRTANHLEGWHWRFKPGGQQDASQHLGVPAAI